MTSEPNVIIPELSASHLDPEMLVDDDDIVAYGDDEDGLDEVIEEVSPASQLLRHSQANELINNETLINSLPPMVSITRVPKSSSAGVGSGSISTSVSSSVDKPSLKIRSDLNMASKNVMARLPASEAAARPGPPPPLMRVGGPQRPGLPPMPRLKLGGGARTAPNNYTASVHHRLPLNNGLMNLIQPYSNSNTADALYQRRQLMMLNQQQRMRAAANAAVANRNSVLPIISGTMSLQSGQRHQQQVFKAGNKLHQAAGRQPVPIRPKTAFSPATSSASVANRPSQVRAVFVPPPMTLKPHISAKPLSNSVPNSMSITLTNEQNNSITITPITNGKSETQCASRSDEEYQVDEFDDDGVNEDDDEYNEITEAPMSLASGGRVVPIKNLLGETPPVSGSVTLHRLVGGGATRQSADLHANSLKQNNPSRRNSVDSVESNSTAISSDSSGHSKSSGTAKKSVKGNLDSLAVKSEANASSLTVKIQTTNSQTAKGQAIAGQAVKSPLINSQKGRSQANGVHKHNEKASTTAFALNNNSSSGLTEVAKRKLDTFVQDSNTPEVALKKKKVDHKVNDIDSRADADKTRTSPDDQVQPPFAACNCEAGSLSVEGKSGLQCQAVDMVGNARVGCMNKSERSEIHKTSANSDPIVLCDLHKDRLQGHGCCPICGEFCSHGLVFMCRLDSNSVPHLFHRLCYQSKPKDLKCCPHCGSKKAPLAVQLKLSMSSTPLKVLDFTAKMKLPAKPGIADQDPPKTEATDVSKQEPSPPVKPERWQIDIKRKKVVEYRLPDGKIISAEGLPNGLEADNLKHILSEFDCKTIAKHTTRNMYPPTVSGDNLKLLQLLALDYSPRQKFSEANGGTPLHVAAEYNHVLTAHIMLQAGAEINAFNDANETPLMIAARQGHADIVRYLLLAGALVDMRTDDGMSALHFATQNGNLECAHLILGQNKLPRNFINSTDEGGWTPLVWACEHRHEPVIRYLLDQGADPFATDVEMNSSLHWAAYSGSPAIVELLLTAGCNINQTNAVGETPLHICLRQDHYETAMLLITKGARLDIPNKAGQVPADCLSGSSPKIEAMIKLGTTLQKLMMERKQKFLTEKTVSQDITNGKEQIPISAVNGEDFEMGPTGYVYVKNNVMTSNLPIDRNISKLQHCNCTDNCVSEDTCVCSDNSVRSWYDQNGTLKEGFDFNDPPMIFECNDMCTCNVASCNNRVVQHGILARIQVYKTYGMGWGAKSLMDIPKGGFVCEYVGELISDGEAEQRENDSYLFDLENREGDTFCIDANKYGNVARFINHSCSPNLIPVKVFTSHQDLRFPHIAFFASKDIKKGDVLGFDYGEKFWVIKHKFFTCWCGGEKCKYSKTAIGKTLESYYRKMDESESSGEADPGDQGPTKSTKAVKKEGSKPTAKSDGTDSPKSGVTKTSKAKAPNPSKLLDVKPTVTSTGNKKSTQTAKKQATTPAEPNSNSKVKQEVGTKSDKVKLSMTSHEKELAAKPDASLPPKVKDTMAVGSTTSASSPQRTSSTTASHTSAASKPVSSVSTANPLSTTTAKASSEPQPQTGKLKLKLRMEEGKVVRVDDSGLLPDEPDHPRRTSPIHTSSSLMSGMSKSSEEDESKGSKEPKAKCSKAVSSSTTHKKDKMAISDNAREKLAMEKESPLVRKEDCQNSSTKQRELPSSVESSLPFKTESKRRDSREDKSPSVTSDQDVYEQPPVYTVKIGDRSLSGEDRKSPVLTIKASLGVVTTTERRVSTDSIGRRKSAEEKPSLEASKYGSASDESSPKANTGPTADSSAGNEDHKSKLPREHENGKTRRGSQQNVTSSQSFEEEFPAESSPGHELITRDASPKPGEAGVGKDPEMACPAKVEAVKIDDVANPDIGFSASQVDNVEKSCKPLEPCDDSVSDSEPRLLLREERCIEDGDKAVLQEPQNLTDQIIDEIDSQPSIGLKSNLSVEDALAHDAVRDESPDSAQKTVSQDALPAKVMTEVKEDKDAKNASQKMEGQLKIETAPADKGDSTSDSGVDGISVRMDESFGKNMNPAVILDKMDVARVKLESKSLISDKETRSKANAAGADAARKDTNNVTKALPTKRTLRSSDNDSSSSANQSRDSSPATTAGQPGSVKRIRGRPLASTVAGVNKRSVADRTKSPTLSTGSLSSNSGYGKRSRSGSLASIGSETSGHHSSESSTPIIATRASGSETPSSPITRSGNRPKRAKKAAGKE